MHNKSYLIIILALLIHTNTYSSDSFSEKPLTALAFSLGLVVTFYSGYLLFFSEHKNYSSVSAGSKTYYGKGRISVTNNTVYFNGEEIKEFSWLDTLKAYTIGLNLSSINNLATTGIVCKDNTIIIAGDNNKDSLLVKASGQMESRDCDLIHTIDIPYFLAEIVIDDKKQPHIEIDQAFKDLVFTSHNGILSVSTKDKNAIKFEYNGKPLCKIYAGISGESLTTNNNTKVKIHEWNSSIKKLYCYGTSEINGDINDTDELSFVTKNESLCLLNINQLKSLEANIEDDSRVGLQGSVNMQTINVFSNAIYSATYLRTQQAIINAYDNTVASLYVEKELTVNASSNATITAQGKADHQSIKVSSNSTYNGTEVASKTATVQASSNATAHFDVKENLTGSASSNSTVTYKKRPPIVNVSCSSNASCRQAYY